MYRLALRLLVCGLMIMNCTVNANAEPSPGVIPFISRVPGNVHLIYDFVTSQPPLPKPWIDKHCADLKKKIAQFSKQPGGAAQARAYSDLMHSWQLRYKESQTKHGTVEYWATQNSELWIGSVETVVYNGRYVCVSHPYDIGIKSSPVANGIVLMGVPKQTLDESIPCLGFVQPGSSVFEARVVGVKSTSDGCEEERGSGGHHYILAYNKLGLLTSIRHVALGTTLDAYEFSDHSQLTPNFRYPRVVRSLRYVVDQDSQNKQSANLLEATEYRARSIDTAALPQAIYNVDHPRAGVWVQDDRPEITKNHGSVVYTYVNRKHTLTQTSAQVNKVRAQVHKRSLTSVLGSGVRIVAILAILVFVGRSLFFLTRGAAAAKS